MKIKFKFREENSKLITYFYKIKTHITQETVISSLMKRNNINSRFPTHWKRNFEMKKFLIYFAPKFKNNSKSFNKIKNKKRGERRGRNSNHPSLAHKLLIR